MDVLEAIRSRRSTRAYLAKPVSKETMERLLEAAMEAPSAINMQPWEVVVVSGEERKRLSRLIVKRMRERNIGCAPGAKRALAQHFVEREKGLLEVISPHIPKNVHFQDFINEGSCNFYGAPVAVIICIDEVFSSARLTDIGIFVGYFILAAHAMGLGTCPIGLITAFEDDIKELLNIREEKRVVIGIAVGYADDNSPINRARSKRVPLSEVVEWWE